MHTKIITFQPQQDKEKILKKEQAEKEKKKKYANRFPIPPPPPKPTHRLVEEPPLDNHYIQLLRRKKWAWKEKEAQTVKLISEHIEANPQQKYGTVLYPLNAENAKLIGFEVSASVNTDEFQQGRKNEFSKFSEILQSKKLKMIQTYSPPEPSQPRKAWGSQEKPIFILHPIQSTLKYQMTLLSTTRIQ